jgi:hypothetical protein
MDMAWKRSPQRRSQERWAATATRVPNWHPISREDLISFSLLLAPRSPLLMEGDGTKSCLRIKSGAGYQRDFCSSLTEHLAA